MPRIVCIGGAVQDIFLYQSSDLVPVCEQPDECFVELKLGAKVDVNAIVSSTGGGATNAAVTFARQGIEAAFYGVVGDDLAGAAVLQQLDEEGVDTRHVVHSSKHQTGVSVLLLVPGGERTIVTYRGASTHYREEDFSLDTVQADWLYITSLAGNMQVLNKLVTQAKQQHMKIFFNPGKGELEQAEQLRNVLSHVDVLLANKQEMQQIVSGDTAAELVRQALNLVPCAIVTDGPRGAVASDGKMVVAAGQYDGEPAVDRTGAGDAFGSGFLSQWAQGASLERAMWVASANAASVVAQVGAKAGILPRYTELHDMPLVVRELPHQLQRDKGASAPEQSDKTVADTEVEETQEEADQ